MDKIGPICRNVEDCAIVLEAIRGSDGLDHAVINAPFNYASNLDLKKLRVGYRSAFVNATILDRLRAIVEFVCFVDHTSWHQHWCFCSAHFRHCMLKLKQKLRHTTSRASTR